MENWDDLRFFLALSRAGSLASAAAELGVNQSTVYRRLGALEDRLGARVFDRRRRGSYALTPAGERLMERAAAVEEAITEIDRDVLGRDLELSGVIRVTTAEDIAIALLPRHLEAFRARYPCIVVDLIVSNRYYSLGRGEADVAIRPGRPPKEEAVVRRKICPLRYGLFASKRYLRDNGTPKREGDLAKHRFIGWDVERAGTSFGKVVESFVDSGSAAFRTNSLVTQRAAAEAGLGIAVLPTFLGEASKRLVSVMSSAPMPSGALYILLHGDLRQTARVRAFIDFMAPALLADPALAASA